MQILLLFLLLVFFILNVKCVESAGQKDITDVRKKKKGVPETIQKSKPH